MLHTDICKICKKEFTRYWSKSQYKPVCCGNECAKKWRSHLMKIRNANQFRWSDLNEKQKKERIKQRLDKKTEKTAGCWLWKGNLDKDGYGQLLAGQYGDQFPERKAHRISWYLTYGKIPKGKVLMHICDVRNCINPKHLRIATHKENIQDCVKKGRTKRGSKNLYTKLNESQVKEIKKKLEVGIKCRKLAENYKVHRTTIQSIKNGKTWNHVGKPNAKNLNVKKPKKNNWRRLRRIY